MVRPMKMGSEAAPTASKPAIAVPLGKRTVLDSRSHGGRARASLRAAIDAKCKSCIHDPESGNGGWREQVAACSSGNCPLHPVRPLPVKATKKGNEEREAVSCVMTAEAAGSTLPAGKLGSNDLVSDERRVA